MLPFLGLGVGAQGADGGGAEVGVQGCGGQVCGDGSHFFEWFLGFFGGYVGCVVWWVGVVIYGAVRAGRRKCLLKNIKLENRSRRREDYRLSLYRFWKSVECSRCEVTYKAFHR